MQATWSAVRQNSIAFFCESFSRSPSHWTGSVKLPDQVGDDRVNSTSMSCWLLAELDPFELDSPSATEAMSGSTIRRR